jgi:hypothetical protein
VEAPENKDGGEMRIIERPRFCIDSGFEQGGKMIDDDVVD